MEKLLFSQSEARAMLGVGEKAFRALGMKARKVGKRKKYHMDDINAFINNLERIEPCQSIKGKGRRISSTASRSEGLGFAAAVRQTIEKRQKQSKPNSARMLSLVSTSSESHA